jgi:molybdopterin converting factor small subunit
MAVKVLIPTPLQKFTNNQATIEIECNGTSEAQLNVGKLIESLDANCPGIKARLCDEEGKPRRFLNFYVNSEDIRFLEGTETILHEGDEVSIVPAVAGG